MLLQCGCYAAELLTVRLDDSALGNDAQRSPDALSIVPALSLETSLPCQADFVHCMVYTTTGFMGRLKL